MTCLFRELLGGGRSSNMLARLLAVPLIAASLSTSSAASGIVTASRLAPFVVSQSSTAQPSVAKLAERLAHGDLQSRREAAWSLAQLGPSASLAIPELIQAAREQDAQLGNGALQALGAIGAPAADALPVVLEQLRDRDDQRRYRAAFALGRIASTDAPEIAAGLADESARLRAATAEAVGWMEGRGRRHVTALIRLLDDDDASVSAASVRALRQLGGVAVPDLAQAIASHAESTTEVQRRAAEILGDIGVVAAEAEPVLIGLAASAADPAVRAAALSALSRISETDASSAAARDAVLTGLEDAQMMVRQAAISAVMRMPAVQRHPAVVSPLLASLDQDPETAKLAAFALGRLGTNATEAVPELLRRLQRDALDETATLPIRISLSQLGPVAIPALLEAFATSQLDAETTASVINAMGPRALPAIRSQLAHGDSTARALALRSIGQLAPAREALDHLQQGLSDADAQVRAAAAIGLKALGPAGRSAADALVPLARDASAEVRGAALAALTSIEVDDDLANPILLAGLQDESAAVRQLAAASAKRLANLTAPLLDSLAACLADADLRVAVTAAETLAAQDQLPRSLASPLTSALERENKELTAAVITAIGHLGEVSADVLAAVDTSLRSSQASLRQAALQTVQQLGPQASELRLSVTDLRHHEDPATRSAAIAALVAIMDTPSERIELLVAALDDPDWVVRRQTAELLADMGREAKPAVPRLLVMLRSDDEQSSEAASSALRRIDAAPREAVPLLVEILQDEQSDRRERYYALHLLRKAGAEAKSALPALRQLREEADGRVQEYIDRAIREIDEATES